MTELERLQKELTEIKASMRSWEIAREIDILANSDKQWNELLEENEKYRAILLELVELYQTTSFSQYDGPYITKIALKAQKVLEK